MIKNNDLIVVILKNLLYDIKVDKKEVYIYMKKVVLSLVLLAILNVALFTLTGCEISAKTDDNSVSVSVDDETKGTFEGILDWIQERIDRIFK